MVLNFTKTSALWVAEFIASSDFNLHIEGVKVRDLEVYQRGVGDGKYFIVTDAKENLSYASEVYDMDFAALVYPKHIKVVCRTEPSLAEITTDGEVTEIKSQSKEVEVTSNGTLEVTPDVGFAYLNSVKVKTNVAQSGGGGGSASSVEYWDVSNNAEFAKKAKTVAYLLKVESSGECSIQTQGVNTSYNTLLAISVDTKKPLFAMSGMAFTAIEFLIGNGVSETIISSIPRITEAEFYNLNVEV
jgi:hypothetical protein